MAAKAPAPAYIQYTQPPVAIDGGAVEAAGLAEWAVREKLTTLADIYRFTVEQTALARGELLELTIVLILILELVLFFTGIMR